MSLRQERKSAKENLGFEFSIYATNWWSPVSNFGHALLLLALIFFCREKISLSLKMWEKIRFTSNSLIFLPPPTIELPKRGDEERIPFELRERMASKFRIGIYLVYTPVFTDWWGNVFVFFVVRSSMWKYSKSQVDGSKRWNVIHPWKPSLFSMPPLLHTVSYKSYEGKNISFWHTFLHAERFESLTAAHTTFPPSDWLFVWFLGSTKFPHNS